MNGSNFAVEQTAGSHSVGAAAHRGRWAAQDDNLRALTGTPIEDLSTIDSSGGTVRKPPSIDAIYEELFESLARYPPGTEGGIQPEEVLGAGSLDDQPPGKSTSRLIGIVFCRPGSKYADEIIKDLPYYNFRSGSFVDFFFAGYGSEWAADGDPDSKAVAKFNEQDEWCFSPQAFDSLRREMERRTVWTYAGGTDILLFAARGDRSTLSQELDFGAVIACNFEHMENDGAITSVAIFLESVIRFGEKYTGDDPLWQLSDELGFKRAKGFVLDVLLAVLPEPLRRLFKGGRHLAVRDISKK
jgi:hypothetical protein